MGAFALLALLVALVCTLVGASQPRGSGAGFVWGLAAALFMFSAVILGVQALGVTP